MGTRCLTIVHDDDKEKTPIICLYRQFDGYPEGHGEELTDFLKDIQITDGLPLGDNRKLANGMGCLAAQLVAHFKTEPGGFYLYPPNTRDVGEEYIYHVHRSGNKVVSTLVENEE